MLKPLEIANFFIKIANSENEGMFLFIAGCFIKDVPHLLVAVFPRTQRIDLIFCTSVEFNKIRRTSFRRRNSSMAARSRCSQHIQSLPNLRV